VPPAVCQLTTCEAGGLALLVSASGTLPLYPCPANCSSAFAGTATPAGVAHVVTTDRVYDASFTLTSATVSGVADYVEPGAPLCPAAGSAVGEVVIEASAVGVATRSGKPSTVGTVEGAMIRMAYSYQRVGVGLSLVAQGTAWVRLRFPDEGLRSISAPVTAAGSGVFTAELSDVMARCAAPGPLHYQTMVDVVLGLGPQPPT